jgi:hypothetical protein
MYCSTSIGWHLVRGLLALVCIGTALHYGGPHPLAGFACGVAAFALLRGCPMCWLLGLIDRLQRKTAPPVQHGENRS